MILQTRSLSSCSAIIGQEILFINVKEFQKLWFFSHKKMSASAWWDFLSILQKRTRKFGNMLDHWFFFTAFSDSMDRMSYNFFPSNKKLFFINILNNDLILQEIETTFHWCINNYLIAILISIARMTCPFFCHQEVLFERMTIDGIHDGSRITNELFM